MRRVRYGLILKALRPPLVIYDRLRRDAGGLNFQDLLLAAARMLRERPADPQVFPQSVHASADRRISGYRSDPGRGDAACLTADDPDETNWRRCRPVSRVAVCRRRPEAVDLPVSPGRHRHLQRGEADHSGDRRPCRLADGELSRDRRRWSNGSIEAFRQALSLGSQRRSRRRIRRFQVGRVDERAGDLAGLYLLEATGANKEEILANETLVVARTDSPRAGFRRKVPRSPAERDEPETRAAG